ncbi:C2H2 type zinc-finger-domain-containing protein [Dendryphion nanum]|uniref:C2H2 type zinc-finger-domain-containing protein n=1 Tax=Dendryphion nanum TaxID=256645 RepID=A0A9P9IBZ1_9PLEO|nr:C2H2 type zinc-finger-domain-containing protein [Dendryphion nanum]
MLGTTSANLVTNTDDHANQSPSPIKTSTNFLCTSCQISFQDGQEQRIHMKESWHVCNIKRRMESLPPIPLDEFNLQINQDIRAGNKFTSRRQGSSSSSGDENEDGDLNNQDEQIVSPFQCLFCNQDFASDNIGFALNLEHMQKAHGMSIPHPELVIDMQSFVGYLATEVRAWHECLYCGATKPSTLSIQNHMRDKGHCLLNFDREPELLDFWESSSWLEEDDSATEEEVESPTDLSATEIRIASGKVIESRHAAPTTKKASRRRALVTSTTKALPQNSDDARSFPPPVEPQISSNRQLARREEMSIIGISSQQRQALVLAEKKAQRSEAVARRAREWAYAKSANSQKFDQLDNQMKWGKQNHKLLPR